MAFDAPRVLSDDPEDGITELYYYDNDTGGFIIQSIQDVEPYLELAKTLSNEQPSHWRGDLHHVAILPNVILMQLVDKKILGPGLKILDQKAFDAWLNDRDNQAWRVKKGRV